jgi:hypothetical protein
MLIYQAYILRQLSCPKRELSRTHYLHFLAPNMSFAGTRGMAFPTAELMTSFARFSAVRRLASERIFRQKQLSKYKHLIVLSAI